MEFVISISRHGKSWNLSEGHGKSWKTNMLSENKKAKRLRNLKKTDRRLKTSFNFSRNKNKHGQHSPNIIHAQEVVQEVLSPQEHVSGEKS